MRNDLDSTSPVPDLQTEFANLLNMPEPHIGFGETYCIDAACHKAGFDKDVFYTVIASCGGGVVTPDLQAAYDHFKEVFKHYIDRLASEREAMSAGEDLISYIREFEPEMVQKAQRTVERKRDREIGLLTKLIVTLG